MLCSKEPKELSNRLTINRRIKSNKLRCWTETQNFLLRSIFLINLLPFLLILKWSINSTLELTAIIRDHQNIGDNFVVKPGLFWIAQKTILWGQQFWIDALLRLYKTDYLVNQAGYAEL